MTAAAIRPVEFARTSGAGLALPLISALATGALRRVTDEISRSKAYREGEFYCDPRGIRHVSDIRSRDPGAPRQVRNERAAESGLWQPI